MAISVIRTVIIYLTLVVSMRVMGKRQLGELEPSELVVAVLISDLASHPLQDPGTPLIYGIVPAVTLICCQMLISAVIMKSVRLRNIICGKPSYIIRDGVLSESEMRRNRFTLDELMEQMRKKDIPDIASVQHAVLETDGTLSTLLYPADAPATPRQLGALAEETGCQTIVINDGRVMGENLSGLGFDDKWLRRQLSKNGLKDAKQVFLLAADRSGRVYVCKKRGAS